MPGSYEYKEIEKEMSSNPEQAKHRFLQLTVDQQITVALYARNFPDDPRIKPFLRENGKEKISTIVNRIRIEKNIWDKVELVGVLIAINTQCECIDRNSDTISKLEEIGKTINGSGEYEKEYHRRVQILRDQLKTE